MKDVYLAVVFVLISALSTLALSFVILGCDIDGLTLRPSQFISEQPGHAVAISVEYLEFPTWPSRGTTLILGGDIIYNDNLFEFEQCPPAGADCTPLAVGACGSADPISCRCDTILPGRLHFLIRCDGSPNDPTDIFSPLLSLELKVEGWTEPGRYPISIDNVGAFSGLNHRDRLSPVRGVMGTINVEDPYRALPD